jgi:hypothetical protein
MHAPAVKTPNQVLACLVSANPNVAKQEPSPGVISRGTWILSRQCSAVRSMACTKYLGSSCDPVTRAFIYNSRTIPRAHMVNLGLLTTPYDRLLGFLSYSFTRGVGWVEDSKCDAGRTKLGAELTVLSRGFNDIFKVVKEILMNKRSYAGCS